MSYAISSGRFICTVVHENVRMKELMAKSLQSDFDAILIEPSFSDCFKNLASKSNLPLIFINPAAVLIDYKLPDIIGDVANPVTACPLLTHRAYPKTFAQRFSSTLMTLHQSFFLHFYEFVYKINDPQPYDAYTPITPSLIFVNGHFKKF